MRFQRILGPEEVLGCLFAQLKTQFDWKEKEKTTKLLPKDSDQLPITFLITPLLLTLA